MAVKVNIPAGGSIGAVPPPDAPIETAQPLQQETIEFQRSQARANERELKPFNPPGVVRRLASMVGLTTGGAPVAPAPAVPVAPRTATEDLIADVFGSDTPVAVLAPREHEDVTVVGQGTPIPVFDPMISGDVDQLQDYLPELTEDEKARMPAASTSESPSRGILPDLTTKMAGDKWDGISKGGFSDVGDAQYFPLTGEELRELVVELCNQIVNQIRNDLRFSMALVYPRIRAIVEVRIEGAAEDKDGEFAIQKIKSPKAGEKGGTAWDIARMHADRVCFVMQALKQEFSEDGESEAPPDQIRSELGLSIPRKQVFQQPGGRQIFVDITSPGSDVSALTR